MASSALCDPLNAICSHCSTLIPPTYSLFPVSGSSLPFVSFTWTFLPGRHFTYLKVDNCCGLGLFRSVSVVGDNTARTSFSLLFPLLPPFYIVGWWWLAFTFTYLIFPLLCLRFSPSAPFDILPPFCFPLSMVCCFCSIFLLHGPYRFCVSPPFPCLGILRQDRTGHTYLVTGNLQDYNLPTSLILYLICSQAFLVSFVSSPSLSLPTGRQALV